MDIAVLRHVPHEHLGTIEDVLRERGLDFEYLYRCEDEPAGFSPRGLIVLGGPMGVYDDAKYPFLATHSRMIETAIERGIPVLGICLGAQLIARALGGRVFTNPVKEIGWYDLELTPAGAVDRCLGHLERKETVFQWHGDTFDLPAGARLLATSELCGSQAFRYAQNVYALQFHIEVSAEMIESWLTKPANIEELGTLDYIDPGVIRSSTPRHIARLSLLARGVFGEFCGMVLDGPRRGT